MTDLFLFTLFVAIGYVAGSIPSGWLVARLFHHTDIREHGSGRTGSTNVWRTFGVAAGIASFVGDTLKVILPLVAIRLLFPDKPEGEAITAFVAIIGHNWPIFIGFRGGRGIVPGAAGLAFMVPPLLAVLWAIFLPVMFISRYVSLASLTTVAAAPVLIAIAMFWTHIPTAYLVYAIVGGVLIVVQHRDNIARLLAGNERRISLGRRDS
ncbi:MAG: glycerol-3-phosphate 1-O-acyltransferase PlsY [Chloroflexi bacterium]|nr:glycerol-3-phosphate 1-O-acyltransferase PlsY [Chloroflexota bacterium]